MKQSRKFTHFGNLLNIAMLAGVCTILPAAIPAADADDAPQKAAAGQRSFASPEEAIKELRSATEANDRAALHAIFGPKFDELLTGDDTQDAKNHQHFAAAMAAACKPVPDGDNKVTLEVGTNDWPMPIPLVKADGQWYFDTAAGKEEVVARHIGKDELHAISVCRAFVTAQREFARGDGSYALKFKSTDGKKDGLYWPATGNETPSPFGPVVAQAMVEGGKGPQPFHGYYFKILTRQGKDAPGGKKNYISEGKLTGGFALVAYPEHWDRSGIMTFIVNQDGQVYQRNFDEKSGRIGRAMKEYNPDGEWTLVPDEGVAGAVSEK